MTRFSPALLVGCVLAAVGCSGISREPRIEELASPAPPGSAFPSLAVHETGVHLSWIELGGEGAPARVRVSRSSGSVWDEPETIGSGPTLFVNWADFPSIAVDGAGTLAAHWLERGGGPSFAYGVRFASRGSDATWTPPAIPHVEDHAAENGFVSIVSERPGEFDLVWLDGREMQAGGRMSLRHAVWSGGAFGPEEVLDDDVCTCCQTDMVAFAQRRFVVYRDHAAGEIRDISYVHFDGTEWSSPRSLSDDGWRITGCPVNGPAIGARGAELGVAWFTRADERERVLARLSADFGTTFGERLRIDDGDPIGRVDAAMLADGSLVVTWLERESDAAEVRLRRIVEGRAGPSYTLGRTAQGRDSGFPRVASDGSNVWVAWTETQRPSRVRLVRIGW